MEAERPARLAGADLHPFGGLDVWQLLLNR
ncbi:MAG: hypothetical protein QOG57_5934, partial [Pseudonocardiales bacterium]|nr:hypothetical protein [Pseudonocardiales bacterium]